MTLPKLGILLLVGGSAILMTNSCSDSESNNSLINSSKNARVNVYTLDGKEGDPITLSTAESWINNYAVMNHGEITATFFGQKAINDLLVKSGSMGVRFYYALDGSGNHELLATGTDATGHDLPADLQAVGSAASEKLHSAAASRNIFSGLESDQVTEQVAGQWLGNYTTTNPQGLRAHFFGNEIIRQILRQNGCVGIRAYYAIDNNGIQKLLLIGVTSTGVNILPSSSDRIEDGNGGTIGDNSFPCPTFC